MGRRICHCRGRGQPLCSAAWITPHHSSPRLLRLSASRSPSRSSPRACAYPRWVGASRAGSEGRCRRYRVRVGAVHRQYCRAPVRSAGSPHARDRTRPHCGRLADRRRPRDGAGARVASDIAAAVNGESDPSGSSVGVTLLLTLGRVAASSALMLVPGSARTRRSSDPGSRTKWPRPSFFGRRAGQLVRHGADHSCEWRADRER